MKLVKHKLRVCHIPQIPMNPFQVPMSPFIVEVNNEREAYLMVNALTEQHLFMLDEKVIPDYCNHIYVEMLEDGEWCDYYNDSDYGFEWEDFCEEYCEQLENGEGT